MSKKTKDRKETKSDAVPSITGKTVSSTQWDGPEGDLRIFFEDGSCIVVRYSCMGGVHVTDN